MTTRSRAAWLITGMIFGLGGGYIAATHLKAPFGCGQGEMRVLTRDIVVENEYLFSSTDAPVRGVLRKGTKFEVRGYMAGGAYLVFHSPVPEEQLARISTPLREP